MFSNEINLEFRDEHENTPLICASINRNFKTVKYFIENGADIRVTNNEGKIIMSYIRNEEQRKEIEDLFNDIEYRKKMIKPCRYK